MELWDAEKTKGQLFVCSLCAELRKGPDGSYYRGWQYAPEPPDSELKVIHHALTFHGIPEHQFSEVKCDGAYSRLYFLTDGTSFMSSMTEELGSQCWRIGDWDSGIYRSQYAAAPEELLFPPHDEADLIRQNQDYMARFGVVG